MKTKDKIQKLLREGFIDEKDAQIAIDRINKRIKEIELDQRKDLQESKSKLKGFTFPSRNQ